MGQVCWFVDMDESDVVKIIQHDVLATPEEKTADGGPAGEPGGADSRSVRPPSSVQCWPVTVEPVIFLAMFSVAMSAPLSTQYLWDRISEDVGYNGSKTSGCSNGSITPDPLQKVLQSFVSQLDSHKTQS